jgi:AraC family transcriptional regulator
MANGSFERLRTMAQDSPLGVVGVCYGHDIDSGAFSYAIAIESPAGRSVPQKGMTEITVPESAWAIFTSHGPMVPNYQTMIKRIFSEWFPSSGREHAGTAEIEFYNAHPDPKAADYRCEYWVPLKQ